MIILIGQSTDNCAVVLKKISEWLGELIPRSILDDLAGPSRPWSLCFVHWQDTSLSQWRSPLGKIRVSPYWEWGGGHCFLAKASKHKIQMTTGAKWSVGREAWACFGSGPYRWSPSPAKVRAEPENFSYQFLLPRCLNRSQDKLLRELGTWSREMIT